MPIIQLSILLLTTIIIFWVLLYITTSDIKNNRNIHIDTLVTVKNAEESIEYTINQLACSKGSKEGCIWIIDLDSNDSTKRIVQLLEHKYPYVHPLTKQDAKEIMEHLNLN